jgi:hypothetical protein
MDDLEIETELLEIQSIHESFNTDNPLTYAILLQRCKDKMNEDQIKYIEGEIERLKKREHKIGYKILEKFSDPLSREPLVAKMPPNFMLTE